MSVDCSLVLNLSVYFVVSYNYLVIVSVGCCTDYFCRIYDCGLRFAHEFWIYLLFLFLLINTVANTITIKELRIRGLMFHFRFLLHNLLYWLATGKTHVPAVCGKVKWHHVGFTQIMLCISFVYFCIVLFCGYTLVKLRVWNSVWYILNTAIKGFSTSQLWNSNICSISFNTEQLTFCISAIGVCLI